MSRRPRLLRRLAPLLAALVLLAAASPGSLHAGFTEAIAPEDQQVTTFIPPTPTGIACDWVSESSIQISWQAAQYPVTGYVVRKGASGAESIDVATVNGVGTTQALDPSAAGLATSYAVYAAAGNFLSNTPARVSASTCHNIAPSTPTGLGATSNASSVSLSWSSVPSTDAAPVSGYHVYSDSQLIAQPSAASYVDSSGAAGTSYTYQVSTWGPGGESPLSSGVQAATVTVASGPGSAILTNAGTTLNLSWSASAGATSYTVVWYDSGTPVSTQSGVTATTASYAGTGGRSYLATVSAVNAAGSSSPTTSNPVTLAPATPSSAPTFSNINPTSIQVNWSAQTGATSYTVSGAGSGCTTSTTSCVISGLISDTAYQVSFTATNNGGTSSASPSGSVTTAKLSYSATVLTNSPLAFWRFGETSGTTAADSSGNGRSGSYVNAPALSQVSLTSDQLNPAIGLTGNTHMIAPSTVPHAGGSFSVEMTLKTTHNAERRFPLSRSHGSSAANCEWWFEWTALNSLNFMFCDSSGTSRAIGVGPLNADQTYHAVATYDGSLLRLYIDGALANSGSFPGLTVQNANQPIIVGNIGAWVDAGISYFTGLVDDVSLYSTALSAADVGRHYRAGAYSQVTPDPTNVLSYGASTFNNAYTNHGWHNEQNSALGRSTAQSLDGNGSLQVTAQGANQPVAVASAVGTSGAGVTAGQLYSASIYVRPGSTVRTVTPTLYFYNVSGTIISSVAGTAGTEIAGTWLPLYAQATAPVGARYAAIYVSISSASGASDVHYLDRASIAASTADQAVAGNIAPNHFFNAQPNNASNEIAGSWALYSWYGSGSNPAPTMIQDNLRPHGGAFAEKVSWTGNTGWKGIYAPVSTTAGKLYRISMWVWVDRPMSISTFGYPFGPSNGVYDDPIVSPTPGQWVQITRDSWSNSGTPNSNLYVRSNDPDGTFWIDDVSIVPLN